MRVVITGFMGCGKTAVARELALLRDERCVDLDARITELDGRSPAQIIVDDGETAFREKESAVLRQLLSGNGEELIALGGGAWTIEGNREMLREHGSIAVWLDLPFDYCWKRIQTDAQLRPLAPTRDAAAQLFSERRPIYSLADLRIRVADESPIEVAKKIDALLRQRSHS